MSTNERVILLNLCAVVVTLAVGMYVYRQRREDARNVYFFAYACSLAFLATFELKAAITPGELRYRWLSGAGVPALFLPAFVFGTLASQARRFREAPLWRHLTLLAAPTLAALAFLAWLPALLARLTVREAGGVAFVDTGGGAPLLALLYAPLFIAGFSPLAWLAEGRAFAVAFAASVGVPALLAACWLYAAALPAHLAGAGFEFVHVPGLAALFAIAAAALSAAAAIRHRGIDAEGNAKRTLVFGAVTLTLSGLYVVVENLLEGFFAGILSSDSQSFGIVAALVVAACFGEVQSRASRVVDELFAFLGGGAIERSGDARAAIRRALGVTAGVYLALLAVGAAGLPLPGRVGYLLSGLLLAGTFLHLLVSFYRLEFHYAAYAGVAAGAAALHAALVTWVPAGSPLKPATALVSLLALAAAAFALGRIIAVRIDVPSVLVPLVLLASALDVWSVYRGLTGSLVASRSSALDYLLVAYPAIHRGGVSPYIGAADFLFSSILLGAALQFGFPAVRTVAALFAGFAGAFATVTLTGVGVPALPFLSLGFVAVNARRLALRGRDLLLVAAVGCGVLAIFHAARSLLASVAR